MSDSFSNASAYELFVGRWSRLVAGHFVPWLAIAAGKAWLDVGAGTGILTQAILELASPAKMLAVDTSQAYIDLARQRIQDERVELRTGDALDLVYDRPQFDASVAGLVLNFVPDALQVARNMAQAVVAGGTVAAYVWDYGERMEMMRQFWIAAVALDPAAAALDSGPRFTICKPENLRALFESVGLTAIEVIPIDVETRFADFDDYWLPFTAAQGSVSQYLRGLDDAGRNAIRERLLRQLPIAADGSIRLNARAWAVKGIKPDAS